MVDEVSRANLIPYVKIMGVKAFPESTDGSDVFFCCPANPLGSKSTVLRRS